MKEATKPLTITLPPREVKQLRKLAQRWRMKPEEAALRAIKQHTAQEALDRAQVLGAKLAKRLGIKSDEDVYRMFDEE